MMATTTTTGISHRSLASYPAQQRSFRRRYVCGQTSGAIILVFATVALSIAQEPVAPPPVLQVAPLQAPGGDTSQEVPPISRLPVEGALVENGVPEIADYQQQTPVEMFPEGLSIADVIASLYQCYPEIQLARAEYQRTNGELLSTWGAFDTKLKGDSINEPTGFFENHRHSIGLARQTWWGGYLSAGYRIGRGNFQPWYLERETDKSGEFKVGWVQPLLRGKAIDMNRVAVFQASLARHASQPVLQQAILDAARDATEAYWKWVTAGTILESQRELLRLAVTRGEQYEAGLEAGKFAEIDVILNRQLIAERTVKLLDSERKFQAAGFKLSLFLRDNACQPLVPVSAWIPSQFPITESPRDGNLQTDLAQSLARRPEPRLLQIEIQKMQWERQLASNDTLPTLDMIAEASQDVGTPSSSSDNKDEFLVVVGIQGEVPIQRRKARGKLQSTAAKIAQLRQKLFLQQNKIEAELKTAYNALLLNSQIVEQAELSLRAAVDSLERYRFCIRSWEDRSYRPELARNENE